MKRTLPGDLQGIPGVGKSIARDLVALGIERVEQLRGQRPEAGEVGWGRQDVRGDNRADEARRLGPAPARHVVTMGLRVVVFGRDGGGAEALAKEIGGGAAGMGGDVLDDGDVGAAVARA